MRKDVIRFDVPQKHADVALGRVRPLCRPELRLVIESGLLDSLMLSCYQQGLIDGAQIAGGSRESLYEEPSKHVGVNIFAAPASTKEGR